MMRAASAFALVARSAAFSARMSAFNFRSSSEVRSVFQEAPKETAVAQMGF